MEQEQGSKVVETLACPYCAHESTREVDPWEPGDETGIQTWLGECDGCGYSFEEIDHADRVVSGVLASAGVDAIRPDLRREAVGIVLASLDPVDPVPLPKGRL